MIKKIETFKEGDSLKVTLLLNNFVKGITTNKAPYMSLTFQDNTGSIEGKFWDVKEDVAKDIVAGKLFDVTCEVIKYRNSLQLKVIDMQITNENVDIREFVPSSPISPEVLKEGIKNAIRSIDNEVYRNIVNAIFKEMYQDFFDYPAASKNHHSFAGGLATHVLSMYNLANEMCKLYPALNRDLLVSGVLLHDVGKLFELSGPIATEYTVKGKLLGHISIMQTKVCEVGESLGYQDKEELVLLRHMILSHHGKLEYGSPILPLLMEAEMLYLIDNIDARMNTLETCLKSVEPGEFTSRIFPLENRAFYKPKNA